MLRVSMLDAFEATNIDIRMSKSISRHWSSDDPVEAGEPEGVDEAIEDAMNDALGDDYD